MNRGSWSADEDALVRREYPNRPTADVARMLDRSLPSTYNRARLLGVGKSAAYFASEASQRFNVSDGRGVGSRFQKGCVPANKGLRRPGWGPGRMKDTQFKPGCRQGVAAQNWRPVGTILTDTEGYQRIKVREAKKGEAYGFGNVRVWPLLNRHVWSQANGPIPAGHSIVFKDGNKQNCALDNLELVSRSDLMRRNSYHRFGKDIARTIQLIGAVTRQINKRSRREEQDRRPA